MNATKLHPLIGATVRILRTGRVGTVDNVVPGVDDGDATIRVVFDEGTDSHGRPLSSADWFTVTEVVEIDEDEPRRAVARRLALRALFDDIARGLTSHDLDVLVSSLSTSMVWGTGYRTQAQKLARRGLVSVTEVHAPSSVLVTRATDFGKQFHAWWCERARGVFAMKGVVVQA